MTITSAAEARRIVMVRWRDQKPRKLAAELAQRAGELGKADRQALREALDNAELVGGDAA
jgi:hypothetical protein